MPDAESIAKARIDAMKERVRERIIDEFCARLDDIRQRLIHAFNDGLDKAVEKHLSPRKGKEIEFDEEGCEEADFGLDGQQRQRQQERRPLRFGDDSSVDDC